MSLPVAQAPHGPAQAPQASPLALRNATSLSVYPKTGRKGCTENKGGSLWCRGRRLGELTRDAEVGWRQRECCLARLHRLLQLHRETPANEPRLTRVSFSLAWTQLSLPLLLPLTVLLVLVAGTGLDDFSLSSLLPLLLGLQ